MLCTYILVVMNLVSKLRETSGGVWLQMKTTISAMLQENWLDMLYNVRMVAL